MYPTGTTYLCINVQQAVFSAGRRNYQAGRDAASLTAASRDARSAAGSVARWRLFRVAGSGAIGFDIADAIEAENGGL